MGESLTYNGDFKYTNGSWNDPWSDTGVHRSVYQFKSGTMFGRLMRLNNDSVRFKEVIIRRLSLKNMILHTEFDNISKDVNRAKLVLINRLNNERFSRTADTLTYCKIQRSGSRSDYYLQTAKIITYAQRMNPNLSANISLLVRDDEVIDPLVEAELCGFSPPRDDLDDVEWIFDLNTLRGLGGRSTIMD